MVDYFPWGVSLTAMMNSVKPHKILLNNSSASPIPKRPQTLSSVLIMWHSCIVSVARHNALPIDLKTCTALICKYTTSIQSGRLYGEELVT